MTNEAELVRSGTWLYDGSVVGRVEIWKVRADWTAEEAAEAEDEQPYPKTDLEGFYYACRFSIPSIDLTPNADPRHLGTGGPTLEEAVAYVEATVKQGVTWEG